MKDLLIEVNLKEIRPSKYATKEERWVEAVYHDQIGHRYQVILTHGEHRGKLVEIESWETRPAIPVVLSKMEVYADKLRDLLLENKDRIESRTTLKDVDKYIEMLLDIITAEEKIEDVQVEDAGSNIF